MRCDKELRGSRKGWERRCDKELGGRGKDGRGEEV
jgi:hypothetical protein